MDDLLKLKILLITITICYCSENRDNNYNNSYCSENGDNNYYNSYSNDNGGWQTGNLGSRQRMAPLNLTVSLITGALTVIFSYPPWNDCNARFTTVP